MQVHPDLTDFFTSGGGGGSGDPNFAVAHLLSLAGSTLLGKVVFDRTVAPDEASPFGRGTDSWHWSDSGSAWPSGFRLRIGARPPYEASSGDYAIFPDAAFTSTSNAPPTTSRYRILREEADDTTTLLGELLVEIVSGSVKMTWWTEGSVLDDQRIPFVENTDHRFETFSGSTALDVNDLYVVEHDAVALQSITVE